MSYICQIYNKAKIVKNVLQKTLHKVYGISLNNSQKKVIYFFKGVWGLYALATKKKPILITVDLICKIQHVEKCRSPNVPNVTGRRVKLLNLAAGVGRCLQMILGTWKKNTFGGRHFLTGKTAASGRNIC